MKNKKQYTVKIYRLFDHIAEDTLPDMCLSKYSLDVKVKGNHIDSFTVEMDDDMIIEYSRYIGSCSKRNLDEIDNYSMIRFLIDKHKRRKQIRIMDSFYVSIQEAGIRTIPLRYLFWKEFSPSKFNKAKNEYDVKIKLESVELK